MNCYEKKIFLLRQTESGFNDKIKGVIKAELNNGKTILFISIYKAVCPVYEIKIFVFTNGKKLVEFNLNGMAEEKVVDGLQDLKGLEIFLVAKKEVISYVCSEKIIGIEGFLKYEKTDENKGEEENSKENFKQFSNGQFAEYDDEKVATENYFKLENEGNNIYVENADVKSEYKEKQKEGEEQNYTWQDAPSFSKNFGSNYYYSVKERLDSLFENYEREESLCRVVRGGDFIKIPYDEGRYYFVGTIKEDSEIKYLCYGISGKYGTLPEGMGKYCRFVPSSPYSASEEGYFLLFQYADSGEMVTF